MTAPRSSRAAILGAVRAARPAAVPLPTLPALHPLEATSASRAEAYVVAARNAGADVVQGRWSDVASLGAAAVAGAARVASTVPAIPGTVRPDEDPHALGDLDVLVAEGVLGVAENGAVWLPGSRLGVRAGLFLATRVVLVLDAQAVVRDLHAAYARLDVSAEPFGVFVAGPSKTADIEQSLVIGAHGPKALTVLLLRHD